ncbi:MAG: L-threonylcarbamoyladenylate synthase [Candidatus Staskawiczbacteria bacterium]
MPTDTVYGLVCDATNIKALERIFLIKKRSKLKPLLVFTNSITSTKRIAEVNKHQEALIKDKWPGRTTMILIAKNGLSSLVQKDRTIGVRVPKYEFLNLILKYFKKPLAQTSANISDNPAETNIERVIEQFLNKKNQPDIIVDAGNLPKAKPSTIINIIKDNIKIIRK